MATKPAPALMHRKDGTAGPSGSAAERLRELIAQRKARAAVIGLGYVGLPLMVEIGNAGFTVAGFEKDPRKAQAVNAGQSYIADVDSADLQSLLEADRLRATSDDAILESADIVSVCVPTPLRKTRDPDLSYVVAATELIAKRLHPGMLVVLESTTYPGTTDELIVPTLAASGMKVGEDFFVCFSPERVDPGNERFQTRNIPKVIGGVTPTCTELGSLFYGNFVDNVVPVSSPCVAEMVKLLENTFRMINIGLANEMALMCNKMGVNVWEVIDAAATKPFGFMPFYPGPGLGGHCIPVDPHYLSWKIKQTGFEPRFIELASEINHKMPEFIVSKVQGALNSVQKSVNGSHLHVAGVAYKKNVSDTRESPALDILLMLERLGAKVTYSDSFVPELDIETKTLYSTDLFESVKQADCVLIITDHDGVDYRRLAEESKLIVDARNALKGIDSDRIVRL